MFKNIIFDLDGTLLDTLQDLAGAANHALAAMNLPKHPVQDYKLMVGRGIPSLIKNMLPQNNCGVSSQQLALSLFTKYYSAHSQDLTQPYPGIIEMLNQLQSAGHSLAVASNKQQVFTKELVFQFFPNYFAAVIGQENDSPPKPHPACVHKALEIMGASKHETLYVGDSDVDMQTAKNAGISACGVLWGFRTQKELEENGANYIVAQPKQIISICSN